MALALLRKNTRMDIKGGEHSRELLTLSTPRASKTQTNGVNMVCLGCAQQQPQKTQPPSSTSNTLELYAIQY